MKGSLAELLKAKAEATLSRTSWSKLQFFYFPDSSLTKIIMLTWKPPVIYIFYSFKKIIIEISSWSRERESVQVDLVCECTRRGWLAHVFKFSLRQFLNSNFNFKIYTSTFLNLLYLIFRISEYHYRLSLWFMPPLVSG